MEVIERLAVHAERLNVKLALEIHAPHYVEHPEVLAYRELYQRLDCPLLGFIPDFGACVRNIPAAYLHYFHWRGVPQSAVAVALELWHEEGDPFERRARLFAYGEREGWDRVWTAQMSILFGLFSRMPPGEWGKIMPQILHVHGKFYGIGADGTDPAISL